MIPDIELLPDIQRRDEPQPLALASKHIRPILPANTEIMSRVSFNSMNQYGGQATNLRISGLCFDDFDDETEEVLEDPREPDFDRTNWEEVLPLWRLESLYEEILSQDKRQTDDQRKSKELVDKLKSYRKRAKSLIGERAGKVSPEEDRAILKQLQ